METAKRLIDANALIKAIKSFRWFGVPNTLQLMFDYLKIIIRDQPTVDAVEVVHGRWEKPYMNRYGHLCHCCSICGFKASYQDKNYCPDCGAKMDGERKDNEVCL